MEKLWCKACIDYLILSAKDNQKISLKLKLTKRGCEHKNAAVVEIDPLMAFTNE